MTTKQKIALVRVIIDLIKADDILDISEMEFYAEMEQKYNLTDDYLIKAQNIDFGEAVNSLQELSQQELNSVMKDMERLTMVDGDCASEEALLIMALDYCLKPEYKSYCQLISTPVSNIYIEKRNIIYTETFFDEDVNAVLSNPHNHRYIEDDFNIAGLNFVYIPKISKDFRQMNETYLHRVIRFLAPALSKDSQNKIFDTLLNITTKGFCDEFLIKKMRLDPIFDSDPSILFQVCNSNDRVVYMRIALGENVMEDLRNFVDKYKKLTRYNINTIRHQTEETQRFIYKGFHRALFDLMAFPGKFVESEIEIDVLKGEIRFTDISEVISLTTKRLALYIFIIHQSLLSTAHELMIEPKSENRKKANHKIFNKIYGMMTDSEYTDYTTGITQNLAHIKRAIKNLKFLDNSEAYIPERVEGVLRVKIKPHKVFVIDYKGNRIPMTESDEWKSL
ncbi:MAG: hypothetical protein HUJ98_08380 [Bacteroidaceae bacterium]|nr:hypothetical protein [Bacteroidaceae bacterium]